MDDGGTLPSSISPWHDPSQERYANRWLVKLFLQRQKSHFLQSTPPRLSTIWSKRIGSHLFFFPFFLTVYLNEALPITDIWHMSMSLNLTLFVFHAVLQALYPVLSRWEEDPLTPTTKCLVVIVWGYRLKALQTTGTAHLGVKWGTNLPHLAGHQVSTSFYHQLSDQISVSY